MMRIKPRAYVDFETEAIDKRPKYPPVPVGVAIIDGRIKRYMAWGHPTGNNCTKREAVGALRKIYREASKKPVCFHNAKFDIEVGYEHLGLPILEYNQFEDTLFLAYLHDPRDKTFSLKPLADKYLDMPPDEQTALKDWIIANVNGAIESNFGAFIARAPGKLVGKYAVGDVVRTKRLFEKFYPYIQENNMNEAYEREKKLVSIVNEMENNGIKIDVRKLKPDLLEREAEIAKLEQLIRRKLGDCKLQGPQLATALEENGYVSEFEYTEKGNRRTGRESLERVCNNKLIVKQLGRLSRLNKIVGTYMRPWYEAACENDGIFYPWFNQVRGEEKHGTKTGRFSSNFQQVPRKPEDPTLPHMRNYIISSGKGRTLIDRDFSQQELRILAHFEDDDLMLMYQNNPRTDMHEAVNQMIIATVGQILGRPKVKTINFGTIYGSGVAAISESLKVPYSEAKEIIEAHAAALPGLAQLKRDLKKTANQNEPIFTLGNRMYYCEEPKEIKGVMRNFAYKLLNLLIQGSAADHTKEAMIRIYEAMNAEFGSDWRYYLTVHDEFLLDVPLSMWKDCMLTMREAMNFKFMDVPMLSDGKQGRVWGAMKKTKI